LGSQPSFAVVISHSSSQTPMATSHGPAALTRAWNRSGKLTRQVESMRSSRAASAQMWAKSAVDPHGTTSGKRSVTADVAAKPADERRPAAHSVGSQ